MYFIVEIIPRVLGTFLMCCFFRTYLSLLNQFTNIHQGISENEIYELIDTGEIQSLKWNMDMNNEDCTICLEHFNIESNIYEFKCGHYFHTNCVTTWLSIKDTCPICRYQIKSFEEDNITNV